MGRVGLGQQMDLWLSFSFFFLFFSGADLSDTLMDRMVKKKKKTMKLVFENVCYFLID